MKNFFYPLIENPYRNKDIQEGIKILKSNIINKHGFFIGRPTSPISDKKIKKLVGAFEESL